MEYRDWTEGHKGELRHISSGSNPTWSWFKPRDKVVNVASTEINDAIAQVPQAPTPGGAQRFSTQRRKELVGAGSSLLVIALVITLALLNGSKPSSSSANQSAPPISTATPSASTTPPPTTALNPLVADWWASTGKADFVTLSADMKQLGVDGQAQDAPAVQADCQTLASNVQSIQGNAPIPDGTLQQEYSTALSDFASGAADCINGNDQATVTEIGNGGDAFRQLNSDLNSQIGAP
jgi:hypothetical protein